MTLNSSQLRSLTSDSYEYHSWTRTAVNAFWTRVSRSWPQSADFVEVPWIQLSETKVNISVKIRCWHSAMQTLSTINRFELIESEEPVGSITYSQYTIFDVFVRVLRSDNKTSHEAQSEQWAHIGPALSEIEGICRTVNRKHTNHAPDGHAICSLSMQ